MEATLEGALVTDSLTVDSLRKLVERAREKLRPVAEAPTPRLGKWCGAGHCVGSQPPLLNTIWKLGGCEGVASAIFLANLDANGDGEIGADELLAYKEKGQKLVEATLALSLNAGVTAALLLSVVFPLAINPFDPEISERFAFSDETAEIFLLLSYTCWLLMCCISLMTLFISTRVYTFLSFWMPTLESQLWLLQDSSKWILMLAMFPMFMMYLAPVALVLSGLAVAGWFGLLGLIPLVVWYTCHYLFEGHFHKCHLRLQVEARRATGKSTASPVRLQAVHVATQPTC